MKEVLQKLYLLGMFFSLLVGGGCATSSPTLTTGQDLGSRESFIAANGRLYFPAYNLSVNRPPADWEMQENLGEGEIAIWVNGNEGSVIEIMASRALRNFSYHAVAAEFRRATCELVQHRSSTVTCEIVAEDEVYFALNRFYRVSIIYRGLFGDGSVESTLYLHRNGNAVYHFLFMEDAYSLLASDMMHSVVFHENQPHKGRAAEKKSEETLIDACYYGDIRTVGKLIDSGVNINTRDEEGVTALAYAADRGYVDIVEILLQNNAEVNIQSNIGSTPLMNAAFMGHSAIVKMLVASGADVNAQSNEGTTALMNAAACGYKEIVEVLLANGADVNECEECGLTALWNAISSGHDAIVDLLIEEGADVNISAADGTTPLMNAAFTGNVCVVKMLLAAGAEVNVKADNGLTALKLAKRKGYAEIVRLLINAGAREDRKSGPIFISRLD